MGLEIIVRVMRQTLLKTFILSKTVATRWPGELNCAPLQMFVHQKFHIILVGVVRRYVTNIRKILTLSSIRRILSRTPSSPFKSKNVKFEIKIRFFIVLFKWCSHSAALTHTQTHHRFIF